MKKFGFFFSASLFILTALQSKETLTYQTVKENTITESIWTVETVKDKIRVCGKDKTTEVKLECSSSFSLLDFLEASSSESLAITREKSTLSVKEKHQKTEQLLSYSIDDSPWVQEFKFGFQPFLTGSEKTCSFYIVNAKDLKLHQMVASKQSEESLDINGTVYQTQKIKITLKGLLNKQFWKAEAWFDTKTLFLVQYKSNAGPGTSDVVTTLTKKE